MVHSETALGYGRRGGREPEKPFYHLEPGGKARQKRHADVRTKRQKCSDSKSQSVPDKSSATRPSKRLSCCYLSCNPIDRITRESAAPERIPFLNEILHSVCQNGKCFHGLATQRSQIRTNTRNALLLSGEAFSKGALNLHRRIWLLFAEPLCGFQKELPIFVAQPFQ